MVDFALKTPPQHGTWQQFLDMWLVADQMPVFESAWTMDHFYPLVEPMDGPHLESWTALAALAQATSRLRLGCMVNGMHYRHPAVTANMASTIDHISGGRFNLGLGAGWFEPESDAYGIKLGTLTERFDRFDEGLAVITSLLRNETTDFSGDYYTLTDARCEPKPVQEKLPIVIGGRGPKRTLRSVARFADHWDIVRPTPEDWLSLDEILRSYCDESGRDHTEIRRSVHIMCGVGDDVAELAATGASYGDIGVDLVVYSLRAPYEVAFVEQLGQALDSASA